MRAKKNLFLILFAGLFLASCSSKVSKEPVMASNQDNQKTKKKTMLVISTDYGQMKAVLFDETPLHKENFIKLVKEGYFDSTLFHRVIEGFMIQGGDPTSRNAKPGQMLGNGGPSYTIAAEFKPELVHRKGALAAARQADQVNPRKESSGSQFYIAQGKVYTQEELRTLALRMGKQFNQTQIEAYTTVGGVPFLDYEYTVFGQVVEGLEVIDKIAAVQTDRNDRPKQDIRMTIKLVE